MVKSLKKFGFWEVWVVILYCEIGKAGRLGGLQMFGERVLKMVERLAAKAIEAAVRCFLF